MDNDFIKNLKIGSTLNIPDNVTFGVEIEFVRAKLNDVEIDLDTQVKLGQMDNTWKLEQDDSLYDHNFKGYGGELISPVFRDIKDSYKQIRNACHIIEKNNCYASYKCGGHIHIGSNILKDDVKNYIKLAKLWSIYEEEIIKFSLGETFHYRENMFHYAKSSARYLKLIGVLDEHYGNNLSLENFVKFCGFDKQVAISFFNLNPNRPFRTIEVRCPNGTVNVNIWKNNIMFFTNLLLSTTNNSKDWDMVEKKYNEMKNIENDDYFENINTDKAYELASFIYDDEKNIENFMIQYSKDSKKLVLTR